MSLAIAQQAANAVELLRLKMAAARAHAETKREATPDGPQAPRTKAKVKKRTSDKARDAPAVARSRAILAAAARPAPPSHHTPVKLGRAPEAPTTTSPLTNHLMEKAKQTEHHKHQAEEKEEKTDEHDIEEKEKEETEDDGKRGASEKVVGKRKRGGGVRVRRLEFDGTDDWVHTCDVTGTRFVYLANFVERAEADVLEDQWMRSRRHPPTLTDADQKGRLGWAALTEAHGRTHRVGLVGAKHWSYPSTGGRMVFLTASPSIKPMRDLRSKVEKEVRRHESKYKESNAEYERNSVPAAEFSSALIRTFAHGNQCMTHRGGPTDIAKYSSVAIVSVGASRVIDIVASKETKTSLSGHVGHIRATVAHGSLLILMGASQEHWLYALPKQPTQWLDVPDPAPRSPAVDDDKSNSPKKRARPSPAELKWVAPADPGAHSSQIAWPLRAAVTGPPAHQPVGVAVASLPAAPGASAVRSVSSHPPVPRSAHYQHAHVVFHTFASSLKHGAKPAAKR
jgi:hypothetical protein